MRDMSFSVVQNTTGGLSGPNSARSRLQEVDAVHHRHVPVQQDAVGHAGAAGIQRLLAIAGLGDGEAVRFQDAARDLAHDAAVIDDEAGARHRAAPQAASASASSLATSSTTSSRSSSR